MCIVKYLIMWWVISKAECLLLFVSMHSATVHQLVTTQSLCSVVTSLLLALQLLFGGMPRVVACLHQCVYKSQCTACCPAICFATPLSIARLAALVVWSAIAYSYCYSMSSEVVKLLWCWGNQTIFKGTPSSILCCFLVNLPAVVFKRLIMGWMKANSTNPVAS